MPHSPAPLGVGVQARVPGLDVIGGMHNSVDVQSANLSLTLDHGNPLVSVTTGASDRTLDLPACSLTTVSVEYLVEKADSGAGDVILVGRSHTVTITNASPGVVTWTAHGAVDGMAIVLETTGALPTGLTAGTTYYIVSAATDTFSLATAPGGTAINTSSAGSGTHTAYETINGKPRWTLTTQYEWIRVIAKAEGWVISGCGWFTDVIRAHSSAGLTLYDDGGNVGLFLKDGAAGRIGLGTTDVEAWDADIHAVIEASGEAIAFGGTTGQKRFEFLVNAYRNSAGALTSKASGAASLLHLFDDGRLIWYSMTDPGSADAALTAVADAVIDGDGGTTTMLNLGGAAGGSNRDVTIGLASDAYDWWDESLSRRECEVPTGGLWALTVAGTVRAQFSASNASFVTGTTTSAANLYQASSGTAIQRSTSSLRYKQNVRDIEDDGLIDLLRPILFRSRCDGDDQTIDRYGFGAEDVHAIGARGLVHYIAETESVEETYTDRKGVERTRTVQRPSGRGLIPDGVQYQSIIPILVARVQKLTARVAALEGAKR